jgi:hypothetical protein
MHARKAFKLLFSANLFNLVPSGLEDPIIFLSLQHSKLKKALPRDRLNVFIVK